MIKRVRFVLGAAASLAALPHAARAGNAAPKPQPSHEPHVHGSNGITRIPEHRTVEWKMEVLDGPEFRLSAYGGKVVFVNLFATWCGPCRVEQPTVVAFARAHQGDTAVIGVDIQEEDNVVRAYRKKFEIPYPIAMHRNMYTVPAVFKEPGLIYPTTLVFRPDGTLSCAWMGDQDREWFEAEREFALSG